MDTTYIFTDDCGNGGVHSEVGIIFTSAGIEALNTGLQKLAQEIYPKMVVNNWIGLHATYIWNRTNDKRPGGYDWTETETQQAEDFFVRGIELINLHASQIWQQRIHVGGHKTMYKKGEERFWAILFLLQKLDKYNRVGGSFGLAFIDRHSNPKLERPFSEKIHRFVSNRWSTPNNKPIERVLMPVNFVSSTVSVGVQAADIVAYVLRRSENASPDAGEETIFMRNRKRELTKLNVTSIWP